MASELLLTFANPVFSNFAFYVTVVVVKMMLMSLLTARQRFKKGAFANQEDINRPDKKPILNDPDVERVRRNHLNDIENIIPFVLIGSLYVLTSPALSTALWHFRIFVAARILHTFCYEIPIPQPSRALTFLVGYGVTLSMAFSVIRASGVF